MRRDRRADCGGTWYRDSEDALEVRGRRIAPFGAAVKWLQSLPPEEREVAIKEMRDEAELTGDIDGEFFSGPRMPLGYRHVARRLRPRIEGRSVSSIRKDLS